MPLSLRDTAFALDQPSSAPWSLKQSVNQPMWPPALAADGTLSVHRLAARFSGAGKKLRSLSNSTTNVWPHINRDTVVSELRARLRDPMIIQQDPTGLCGPIAILVEWARRDPRDYVMAAQEILETGQLICTGGRIIVAQEDLRQEPVASGNIGQVDWLLAATMRDDENVNEDIEGDAYGWESVTFPNEQAGWIRDVLRLSFARYGFDLGSREIEFMRVAQAAVNAGGVAFFCIDSNLLTDGGTTNREEDIWYRSKRHSAGSAPGALSALTHSLDDWWTPPDHWVIYLGGLNLGPEPEWDERITFRLWSWGHEFEVEGTVDAFSEYLYGVAAAPVSPSNPDGTSFGFP